MSFEFPLPSFPAESPEQRQMYAYLYRTVQQLNWAMKQLRPEQGERVWQTGSGGALAASAERTDNLKELKDLIIKSADVVDSFYMSLRKRLQGSYVARSEFGTYQQQTALELEATDKRIDQNYENIQLITTHMTKTNAYIRTGLLEEDQDGTGIYGLEIGQTRELNDQPVFSRFARFTSSRLSFFDQNNTEIAYISDFKLYITNAHVTGSLTVGDYVLETSDGLAFRWVGA